MSAPQPAAWAQQPLTREEAAHGREWLRQDYWAFWYCLAGHIRVTWGHDWGQALAYQLAGYREKRTDVPADDVLIPLAQGMPWEWAARYARYWPLAERAAGGGVIDRSRAMRASELPGWKDDRHLVQGRMFTNQLTLLHGAPAASKGFVIIDLAFRCALGLPWFGAAVTRRTRSLVIYPEASRRLSRRMDAWCIANGRNAAELGDVMFYPLALPLDDQSTAGIIEWCQDEGFGQVIADNLFSMTPGQDLRGPEASGEVMSRLARIKDETGGHVLAVHHDTKMGGYYGGVQFDAFADTRIAAVADGDVRTLTAGLGDGKQRDLAPFQITFRLEVIPLGHDADGNPVSSCAVREMTPAEIADARTTREAKRDTAIAEAQAYPDESARNLARKLNPDLHAGIRTIERWIGDYRRGAGR